MSRLAATLRADLKLQFRQGFYYASAFVIVFMILIFGQMATAQVRALWPATILLSVAVNCFFFIAGLVLLEKGEGTLEAQVVTPLRPAEYVASKVITLCAMSLLEMLLMVSVLSGLEHNWAWLILGIVALSALYALLGFVVVSRFDSISEFMMPGALWMLVFALPVLRYLGAIGSDVMLLHPMQAPLTLLQAAFAPMDAWRIAYGIGYSLLWSAILAAASLRAYHRFVVRKEGTR